MSKIEEVALALKRYETHKDAELSDSDPWRKWEIGKACAMLRALREPDERIKSVLGYKADLKPSETIECWQSVIDSILSEAGEKP